MNYYKRHIGDYHKKAGRLSIIQHGVYNLLIDACYDREKFPTLEEAIDWCWASTDEEISAVEFVLKKFFINENGVFVQNRINDEIQEYYSKCDTNKQNGKKGGRPKGSKNNLNKTQSVNLKTQSVNLKTEPKPKKTEPGLTNNHKPITTNQEPRTKKNTLSSKHDDDDRLACEIIDHLNQKSGKLFRHTKANKRLITARLNDPDAPADKTTCFAVIDSKVDEWSGTKMEKYLRPSTLFNAEKFDQYAGEIGKKSFEDQKMQDWLSGKDVSIFETNTNVIEGEFKNVN